MYKKLGFETSTHPPFMPCPQNPQFFFLTASLINLAEEILSVSNTGRYSANFFDLFQGPEKHYFVSNQPFLDQ